jgi:hypothetical protein
VHVQSFVVVQSPSHVAPSSHVIVQLPPAQVSLHVEPALQSWVQPPAEQSKLQSAPLSHVWVQSVADVLQSALHRLSSLQAILHPETVQLCVQSSSFLHSHGSVPLQPIVRVVRGGFGTSASPPPVPESPAPPELAPPELEDDPVSSPSSDVQAETTKNAPKTRATPMRPEQRRRW